MLKAEIDQTLKSICELPEDIKKAKVQDVKKMIDYYDGMTKNIEDRRNRIAELAWQNVAISLTAFGVIVSLPIIAIIKIPLVLVLGTILIISILKIIEYRVQSEFRYPFLNFSKFGNKWKWMYHGNRFVTEINDNPFTVKKSRNLDELRFLQGLNLFLTGYSEEDLSQELYDDLIQLFLLQVHNYYKNRFYLRLLKYDHATLRILFILQSVYWIIALILLAINPSETNVLLTHLF